MQALRSQVDFQVGASSCLSLLQILSLVGEEEVRIFKCDKCGDQHDDIEMRGTANFSFGLYSAVVTAYLKVNDRWVTPSEDDDYHLCKKCVVEIVKDGDLEANV